jgi:predicted PurR-regulated permease PerM
MAERAHDLIRRAREAEPETTAPIDVKLRSVALVIIASAAATALLYWAREVFIPVVLSVLISYALEPIVALFIRLRLPRVIAAALVMVLFTGGVLYGGYALSDQAAAMMAAVPQAAAKLRMTLRHNNTRSGTIQQVEQAANELQRAADEATARNPVGAGVQRVQIEQPAVDVRGYLMWGSASAVAFAGQATLVVFFVFFLLASGNLVKQKLVKLAGPSFERKKITLQILNEIDRQIERFLLLRIATSTIVGVATWLAFRWMGVNQAAMWGVAAGVFNSIPYFGPVIVAAGTAIAGFLQFGTITMALYVAGVSIMITSL